MVYAVFGGCYSDWYCVGYFTNREDAEKYCIKYKEDKYGDSYYVVEIKDLSNTCDLSNISLMYEHKVVFDFKDKKWIMRNEPNRYRYYSDNKLRCNNVRDSREYNTRRPWIEFNINLLENNRKKAEKIAQDYLYELIYESHCSDNSILPEVIDSLNNSFINEVRSSE